MFVGVLEIHLVVNGSRSLKDKRRIIQMVQAKIRNKFNASVAEVDGQDLWQKSVIGVCILGTDKRHVNSSLSKVVELVNHFPPVSLVDYSLEIL